MTVTVLVAVALGTAGCGGSKSTSQGSSSTSTSATQTQPSNNGPALTAAQLIAKADPICARMTAVRLSHKIRSRQDYLRVSAELYGSEQQALAEMRKLVPPGSLAETWSKMLTSYKAISEDVSKVGQVAATGNSTELQPLATNATRLQHQVAELARAAGFKECGQFL